MTAAANAPTEWPATNCGVSPWSSVSARAHATPAISRASWTLVGVLQRGGVSRSPWQPEAREDGFAHQRRMADDARGCRAVRAACPGCWEPWPGNRSARLIATRIGAAMQARPARRCFTMTSADWSTTSSASATHPRGSRPDSPPARANVERLCDVREPTQHRRLSGRLRRDHQIEVAVGCGGRLTRWPVRSRRCRSGPHAAPRRPGAAGPDPARRCRTRRAAATFSRRQMSRASTTSRTSSGRT